MQRYSHMSEYLCHTIWDNEGISCVHYNRLGPLLHQAVPSDIWLGFGPRTLSANYSNGPKTILYLFEWPLDHIMAIPCSIGVHLDHIFSLRVA